MKITFIKGEKTTDEDFTAVSKLITDKTSARWIITSTDENGAEEVLTVDGAIAELTGSTTSEGGTGKSHTASRITNRLR